MKFIVPAGTLALLGVIVLTVVLSRHERRGVAGKPLVQSTMTEGGSPPSSMPATAPSSGPTTRPATRPAVLPERADIPSVWRQIASKAEADVPPFDDLGRPGAGEKTPAGFFEMMREFNKLSKDQKPAYLTWLATTRENPDLRIWACSMLADMERSAELREVLTKQREPRVKEYVEGALKRMLERPKGGKKAK